MVAAPQTANTLPAPPAWTTPRRLQSALLVLWLATGLFLAACLAGAHAHRQALQTIGRDAAPAILGAQKIKAGLSDMDAAAADVLLLPPGTAQEDEDDHYELRRVEVTEALEDARRGSQSAVERQSLHALADALGTYQTDVAQARLLHLRGEAGSRLVYRMTHSEMHDTLLPAADALVAASSRVLETAYRHQQVASGAALAAVWVAGLLLTTLLAATQVYLSRQTRRILNLPLLGATVLVVVLLFGTSRLFAGESDTLHAASGAFASVSTLWQMRATAFDANSEESRWLMDAPQSPQYAQLFGAQSARIVDTLHTLPSEELTNAYSVYDGTHRHVRALEDGGNHGGAVAFCVGRGPGQHDGAFLAFDAALGRALDTRQGEFDRAVADGFGHGDGYDARAVLVLLAAALLTGLGLRARLREYTL